MLVCMFAPAIQENLSAAILAASNAQVGQPGFVSFWHPQQASHSNLRTATEFKGLVTHELK